MDEDRPRQTAGREAHAWASPGQSFLLNANGSNFGSMFVILDDFDDRHGAELSADAIAAELRAQFYAGDPGGAWSASSAPRRSTAWATPAASSSWSRTAATRGLGHAARPDRQPGRARATQTPGLVGLFSMFRANTPQLYVDIDRTKCKTMGVALSDVFDALQVNLGGYYVNDFNQFGRTWQVNVQADAPFRMPARGRRAAEGPQRRRATWCRWARWPTSSDISGPGDDQPLQHVPGRGHQRRLGARRRVPARRSRRWKRWPNDELPAGDGHRVDRADATCRSWPATRRCSSSRCACCSCSSRTRPSTRAGRCRWRSS